MPSARYWGESDAGNVVGSALARWAAPLRTSRTATARVRRRVPVVDRKMVLGWRLADRSVSTLYGPDAKLQTPRPNSSVGARQCVARRSDRTRPGQARPGRRATSPLRSLCRTRLASSSAAGIHDSGFPGCSTSARTFTSLSEVRRRSAARARPLRASGPPADTAGSILSRTRRRPLGPARHRRCA